MKKGNKVKDYKGVIIYITTEGEFFCDCYDNSNDYRNKTFNSNKLSSIEKAIDNFEGNKLQEVFYNIKTYPVKIEKITAISRVGNRIMYSDGTTSLDYNRKNLYDKSVESKDEFKKLKKLESEYNKLQAEASSIRTQLSVIQSRASNLKSNL